MPLIKYAVSHDRVATITLNRDDKRNAINRDMARQILDGLAKAESDAVRLVILRANRNAKVWCAGSDLAELDPQVLQTENPTLDIVARIQSSSFPVLAMVEGGVYAGGLLILIGADIVVAARNARVAITSNKLGIPLEPELYAYWLRVMGIHKAKELLFTAEPISADDAYHAGLYNHVVDKDQLEATAETIARSILDCNPEVVANTKHQLNLIAMQSALSDEAHQDIKKRNEQILNSTHTQQRIEELLASLRSSSN